MSRLRERLASDSQRAIWATVACTLVSLVVTVTVYSFSDFSAGHRGALGALVAWVGLAFIHTALTFWAFAGRTGQDLADVLRTHSAVYERSQRRKTWVRWLTSSDDAASWSATLAVMALVALGALVLTPGLRSSALLVSLGVALVLSSWLNVVTTFAVQYARTDAAHPSFIFAGDEQRSFEDYLYVALAAQATLGTTDVTVTTTRMRRLLSMQTMVAFAFNTVIMAMVVSLLVSGL